MNSRKPRNFRNNFDRTILDKQVDKIFETGRQFVDGVSGSRPGKKLSLIHISEPTRPY